jgi:hypothetical protein
LLKGDTTDAHTSKRIISIRTRNIKNSATHVIVINKLLKCGIDVSVTQENPKYIKILLKLQLILNIVVMMTLADLLLQLLLLHSALGNLGLAVIFNVFKSHTLGSLNWKAQHSIPNQLHIQQRVKQAVNKYSQITDGINSL